MEKQRQQRLEAEKQAKKEAERAEKEAAREAEKQTRRRAERAEREAAKEAEKAEKRELFSRIDEAAKLKKNPLPNPDSIKRRVNDGRYTIEKAEEILSRHLPEESSSSSEVDVNAFPK